MQKTLEELTINKSKHDYYLIQVLVNLKNLDTYEKLTVFECKKNKTAIAHSEIASNPQPEPSSSREENEIDMRTFPSTNAVLVPVPDMD